MGGPTTVSGLMLEVGAMHTVRAARVMTVWRAMRPPFLLLSVVCVLLGLAVARRMGATPAMLDVALVLGGALAAHASANLFNEYEDARSGLDHHTQRTPFSGGSGALIDDPRGARTVRGAARVMLTITVLVGLVCVARHGLLVVPIGGLGVMLVVAYTPWVNRHPLLCLLAPGLGVGPLLVLGTVAVLCERLSPLALSAALVPGLLGSGLLLANQFPDIEADRGVGRRHVAIAYGRACARRVFAGLALATALVVVVTVATRLFPLPALWALLPLSATLPTFMALRGTPSGAALTPYLASNVLATLLTPLTLAVVLWSA